MVGRPQGDYDFVSPVMGAGCVLIGHCGSRSGSAREIAMSKFYEIHNHEEKDAWTGTPAPYVVIDGLFSIAEMEAIVEEMKAEAKKDRGGDYKHVIDFADGKASAEYIQSLVNACG